MTTSLLLIFVALQAPALSQNGIGVITGQILAADGQPASGVSVLVAVGTLKNGKTNLIPIAVSIPNTMAKTDNTGHYRIENVPPGRYFLLAQPITISNGEVATLYPGVTSLNAARKVEVGPDSELSGIDFSIAQSSLVKIRGHVLNAITGAPSKAASVSLTGGVFSSFRTMVDDRGSFEFSNVPVGNYVIWASEENRGSNRTFSTERINVGEQGLNDVQLIFGDPVAVAGHIVFEGGGSFQNPGMTPGITANIEEGTFGIGTNALMDGSFQLGRLGGTGLVDGEYRLSVDHLADDYYVKSMSFGGIDLLREPLRISGAPSAEIAIVLAAGTSVAGNVQDDGGRAVPNALVYLIHAL